MSRSSAPNGFDKAIELTERAMQASDMEDFEAAADLLEEAMELMPGEEPFTQNYVEFCLQVAQNATLDDDHDQAITYFMRAIDGNPNDAETLMDLGAAHARNNDPVEAIGAWQKALALLNPKKGKDKQNIESILENVRAVQKALKDAE